MSHSESHYETWILALRGWAKDPRLGLTNLPALTTEDLPPEAWARFIEHLLAAQRMVMKTFQDRLSLLVDQAQSDFELAQALIESRRMLQHRVELSQHPSLPGELREKLAKSTRTDIHRIQQELEKLMLDGGRNAPHESTFWERRLVVVQQNPLTAVLHTSTAPTPSPTPPLSRPTPTTSRWAHRRLQ